MIYLDSSALFKKYYQEIGTESVWRLFAERRVLATASLSYAEVLSALNRKLSEHRIGREQYHAAADSLEHDWTELDVIPMRQEVLRQARIVLERHTLRAGDAVQLASALHLAASGPVGFASADRRLNQAATAEGFILLL